MSEHKTPERLVGAVDRAAHYAETARGPTESGRAAKKAQPGFCIALSREAGARGAEVGRALGARLGWPVYDREILQKIGEEMGLHAGLLEGVDEKRQSWLEESLESFTTGCAVSASAYVHRLVQLLLSLAARGECVIVGRGAVQTLPAPTTLRVRLVASLDERTEVVCRRLSLGREEAARWVARTNRERAAFVKEYFHKDSADPHDYDLVLNSARLSTPDCADLIIEALHRLQARATARVESVGK